MHSIEAIKLHPHVHRTPLALHHRLGPPVEPRQQVKGVPAQLIELSKGQLHLPLPLIQLHAAPLECLFPLRQVLLPPPDKRILSRRREAV